MLALLDRDHDPFVASDAEALIAREAVLRLKPLANAKQDIRIRVIGSPEMIVPLPARAVEIIAAVLENMAARKPMSIIPHDAELTTQQAADLLNVSRPHLVTLLEKGEIGFRKVGTHRRVRVCDLFAFKAKSEVSRSKAIDDMVTASQELGLD